MVLQLNNQAKALVIDRIFGELQVKRSDWGKDKIRRYEATQRAYNQLVRVVVYVNQEAIALDLLSQDDIDDLTSAVCRVYESRYWCDVTFRSETTSEPDPGYNEMEWLLIDDQTIHGCGILQESFRMTSLRLLKMCKHSLPLENCLIRLMNAYHLGCQVCDRSIKAIAKEQSIVLADYRDPDKPISTKRKREPKPFRVNYTVDNGKSGRNNTIKRVINAAKFW